MPPRPGQALPEWVVDVVDTAAMVRMAALLADPNPIHLDPDAVRGLGLGDRVVNQGPSNLGYVQNMLIAWAGGVDRIRAVSLRFADPVFGGDRAVAGGRVLAVREAGGERLAECAVWLDAFRPGTATPVRALHGTATVLC